MARDWWTQVHPEAPPLQEAMRCARCGGYFGRLAGYAVYDGHLYHLPHAPLASLIPAGTAGGLTAGEPASS